MAKMLRDSFFSQAVYDRKMGEFETHCDALLNSARIVRTTIHTSFRTPEDVERCTIDNLKAEMEKMRQEERSRYSSALFRDDAYINKMEERHNQLILQWSPLISAMQREVNYFKSHGIGLKIDSSGEVWADSKQAKDAAKRFATIQWTQEDKSLYTKLGELVELMQELRRKEKINYNYLLRLILADRSKPQPYQVLGDVKGLSISPDKYLNLKNVGFGTQVGTMGITPEDFIF